MKRILVMLGLVVSGSRAADFPADTVLPSGWVQRFTEPGFDYDSATFSYARDAKDWLYETRVINEKSGYLHTTVTLTDREGRYRGGSYQKRTDPVITYEAVLNEQGRLGRKIFRQGDIGLNEDYTYDERGGLIERTQTSFGSLRPFKRILWKNTYDSDGRLVLSEESDPEDNHVPWNYRRYYGAEGRLTYMLRPSGAVNGVWDFDSTAYVYGNDGRLLEEREYDHNRKLERTVFWSYKTWQVPVAIARRAPPMPTGYSAGYLGAVFDLRGRRVATRGAAPLFLRR